MQGVGETVTFFTIGYGAAGPLSARIEEKITFHLVGGGICLEYSLDIFQHSVCPRDSANDPTQGRGTATTRRVSVILPATLLGGLALLPLGLSP